MKKILLAALTALSLGAATAHATTLPSHSQQGNNYNFTEGGGG